MKLICVLAVHNEERYLRYSLGSIQKLGCHVVTVLDRCTDGSENLIKRWLPDVTLVYKCGFAWANQCAEAKNVGCEVAKDLGADTILMCDADVMLDVGVVQKALKLLRNPCFDVVAFPYRQYSLYGSFLSRMLSCLQNLFARLNRKLGIHPIRSGVYVGKARAVKLGDYMSEYDVLQQSVHTTWLPSRGIHLRPRFDIKSQMLHGVARAQRPQYTLLKTLLFSVFTLQIFTVAGYLKAKC